MASPVEMTASADRAGEAAFAEALDFAEEVRRDPARLESRLPILYEKLDAFCEEALRGSAIACKPGCENCCHHWVPGVKPFEIERIARHVEASSDRGEIVRGLRERAAAHASLTEEDRDLAYARLGLPCVFLTPERTCGIRAIRPETCRTFFSLGPAERCAGDPEGTGFVLSPHPAFEDVLARAGSAFENGTETSGELIRDLLARLR